MNDSLLRKYLVFVIVISFIGMSTIPSTASISFNPSSNILYVGGSGSGNYITIQEAIDNADNGDTVFVYDDSSPYYENIAINTSITLIGENKENTIIDGSGEGDVVKINANEVNISGFTIRNSGNRLYNSGINNKFYTNYTTITQ